ncbi:MAG: efflux RND transporter permease subunit, partial [Rikenellaceae bacterium]
QIMDDCDKIMLVTSDWERKVPTLDIDYNQAAARQVGLSRQDVAISLLASTEGLPIGNVYDGVERESIIIKNLDKDGNPISNLTTTPIFSMIPSSNILNPSTIEGIITGATSSEEVIASALATTPLSQVIDGVEVKWEDPIIIRYNGQRAMRAQGNNIPSVGAEDARQQIVEAIEAIALPEGYSLTWQGEVETKNNSLKYLMANLPLSIILMIGILIMLFKDYRKPLIIMICVPLLFVGAILGVWISGLPFGFVAICGMLGLIGMMIKNGVVLMDEINAQIKSGKEPFLALVESSDSRFRPVMMASLTTILGMIPLLPDAMFGSLAATIMGGLFFGTLITLIYIPILYSILFKIEIR